MSYIEITGASDDLIEVSGLIEEEFNYYDSDDKPVYMAISDGTLLQIRYDENGIWRITSAVAGSGVITKVDGDVLKDTNDVVRIEGDIKWVALSTTATLNRIKLPF